MERLALILMLAAVPARAFDANGVPLGATEADVRKAYPGARCRAMDWKTDAADRRCDDAQVSFGGALARVSFFLREDAVQAFDVRFDARDLARVAAFLRQRYGTPAEDGREVIERRGRKHEVFKMRWKTPAVRAVLTSQAGQRRAELNVWRGDFNTEVYRIR